MLLTISYTTVFACWFGKHYNKPINQAFWGSATKIVGNVYIKLCV